MRLIDALFESVCAISSANKIVIPAIMGTRCVILRFNLLDTNRIIDRGIDIDSRKAEIFRLFLNIIYFLGQFPKSVTTGKDI